MGEECHSIRPIERSVTSKTTDISRSLAYPLHRNLRVNLLLPVCNTAFLAIADTLHDLLHVLESINVWDPETPFRVSTITACVVTVRFLLPS